MTLSLVPFVVFARASRRGGNLGDLRGQPDRRARTNRRAGPRRRRAGRRCSTRVVTAREEEGRSAVTADLVPRPGPSGTETVIKADQHRPCGCRQCPPASCRTGTCAAARSPGLARSCPDLSRSSPIARQPSESGLVWPPTRPHARHHQQSRLIAERIASCAAKSVFRVKCIPDRPMAPSDMSGAARLATFGDRSSGRRQRRPGGSQGRFLRPSSSPSAAGFLSSRRRSP